MLRNHHGSGCTPTDWFRCVCAGGGGGAGRGGGAQCVRWAHLCTPLPYPPGGVARKVTVPEKHARSIYVYCVVASRANVLCACTLSTADEGITLITVLDEDLTLNVKKTE